MQVSTANSVKVYNLSAGKSLPEWISERKRRTLLKNDIGKLCTRAHLVMYIQCRPISTYEYLVKVCATIIGLRRRIELIQDFAMPVASTQVQTSADGQYILAAGDL